jgi:hypothetical protein
MNKMAAWFVGVVVAGMFVGAGHVRAEEAGSCYIVKATGYDRKIVTEMLPEAEFKAFEKTIKLEQKHFPKAVALAAKEWRADEMNKKIPFPGNSLKARSIMSSQKFPSSEKAGEQMTRIENMEAKKAERLAEQEKNSRGRGRGRGTGSTKDPKKKENLGIAADLVKTKLDALVAGGGAEAGAAELAEGGAKVEAGGAQLGAEAKKGKNEKAPREKGAH